MKNAVSVKTTVFEIMHDHGYVTDEALAIAMGLHPATICRTRSGEYSITARFIAGALRAFPGKSFDQLFSVEREPETADVA